MIALDTAAPWANGPATVQRDCTGVRASRCRTAVRADVRNAPRGTNAFSGTVIESVVDAPRRMVTPNVTDASVPLASNPLTCRAFAPTGVWAGIRTHADSPPWALAANRPSGALTPLRYTVIGLPGPNPPAAIPAVPPAAHDGDAVGVLARIADLGEAEGDALEHVVAGLVPGMVNPGGGEKVMPGLLGKIMGGWVKFGV